MLSQGNREKAANILGIGERTLYRKIKGTGPRRRVAKSKTTSQKAKMDHGFR
ncbi:MAG: helix-turn-helix domain-containing protein [Planctomycetota bacterium]